MKFNPFNRLTWIITILATRVITFLIYLLIQNVLQRWFFYLRLISRCFNKNRDFIEMFISKLKHIFSIIALSETWYKEDDSNLIDILNYTLVSVPRRGRKSGGVALYVHSSLSP